MVVNMEKERVLPLHKKDWLSEALKKLVLKRKPIYNGYLSFSKKEIETENVSKSNSSNASKGEK